MYQLVLNENGYAYALRPRSWLSFPTIMERMPLHPTPHIEHPAFLEAGMRGCRMKQLMPLFLHSLSHLHPG